MAEMRGRRRRKAGATRAQPSSRALASLLLLHLFKGTHEFAYCATNKVTASRNFLLALFSHSSLTDINNGGGTEDGIDARLNTKRNSPGKRIVLIRHGCTYMNEYLSKEGTRWGDPLFTDIFEDPADRARFRDSPLSPRGVRQAQRLSSRIADGGADNIIEDIQLIACSPLTRALQTMEIALFPHVWPGRVPTVALPLASERVYLISDLGRATSELKAQYPIVDFDSEFPSEILDTWWYTPPNNQEDSKTNGNEWRPSDQGQTYACPGEPEVDFNERMASLYDWLADRKETSIVLICHWGVIDWLTGDDYENCEMRVIDFASMRRTGFMHTDAESDEIFGKGERSVVRDQ